MTTEPLPNDLLGLREAAELARCNTQAIFRWIKKGKLRGWRRVGRMFVSKAEVLGLFEPMEGPRERTRRRPSTAQGSSPETIELLRQRGIL
ncbi:MAG: helix-turn-helix domain-containing protein [Gemmataceae bacterium]